MRAWVHEAPVRVSPDMTMDIPAQHVEHVARALEAGPVTYHTVSRALRLHVHVAKKLLFAYYSANKSRVLASFLVSGAHRGRRVLKLFESEVDLSENCHTYVDSVECVHVYCLSFTKNAFSPLEIALAELNHPVPSEGAELLGVTRGPALTPVVLAVRKGQDPAKAKSLGKTPASGDQAVKNAEAKKPEPVLVQEKPKLVYQSRKQQPKASALSGYVSRKGERTPGERIPGERTPGKRSGEPAAKYTYKLRKLEAQQPKERVVMSNAEPPEEEDVAVSNQQARHLQPSHSDLQNLFMDDFSDEDAGKSDSGSVPEKNEPIIVDLKDDSKMGGVEGGDGIEGNEDGAEGDRDVSERNAMGKEKASHIPETAEETNKEANESGNAIEGRKKIPDSDPSASILQDLPAKALDEAAEPIVSETIVDEDGYFTLYKQTPKPEAKPAPARELPRPRTSNTTAAAKTGKNGKKQSSLMNFFGKR